MISKKCKMQKPRGIFFIIIQMFSPRFFYFAFLNIHRWLKIANITPHGPDDGSLEPKRYSVDLSINLSFHLDRFYQFFYILSDYNPLFTFHSI